MNDRIAIILFITASMAVPSMANDAIPPELTGIWGSEGSVFNGHALFEGQGVYLRADGRGMLIGGPPAIGVLFISRYDREKNVLTIRYFSGPGGPNKCVDMELTYDPAKATIHAGVELHRRTAEMPPYFLQYIVSEPVGCSW